MEKSHKRLEVWQKSLQLTKEIYEVTKKLPADEKYGLVSQMRRAAVSIPSNIAEGSARQTQKDAIQFFVIARGSLSELDTQMELTKILSLICDEDLQTVQKQIDIVDSLLSGLIRYRRSKIH
jgi:four helix bundle protein